MKNVLILGAGGNIASKVIDLLLKENNVHLTEFVRTHNHSRESKETMNNNIEGKVIVITGASSGLGEAAAKHLSAQGAIVVLERAVDRIQSLANELTNNGGKALAVATDVTKHQQVKALVDAAVKTYGHIDVIMNNAGLMPQSPLERLKIDEWNQMIDVNIRRHVVRYRCSVAVHEETKIRPHHQCLLRRGA